VIKFFARALEFTLTLPITIQLLWRTRCADPYKKIQLDYLKRFGRLPLDIRDKHRPSEIDNT